MALIKYQDIMPWTLPQRKIPLLNIFRRNGRVCRLDSETGNIIIVQHENNHKSAYKHNSALLKTLGFREKREAIAIIAIAEKIQPAHTFISNCGSTVTLLTQ